MAKRQGRCMACGQETEIGDIPCRNTSVCEACAKDILGGKIQRYRIHYGRSGALRLVCQCKREVVCFGFTNTCVCGRDYNMSGQLLAPRSQWGAETGESVSDILRIDTMSTEELLDSED